MGTFASLSSIFWHKFYTSLNVGSGEQHEISIVNVLLTRKQNLDPVIKHALSIISYWLKVPQLTFNFNLAPNDDFFFGVYVCLFSHLILCDEVLNLNESKQTHKAHPTHENE